MMDNNRFMRALLFVVAIAIPLGAGVVGSLFTTSAITGWYSTISKPSLTPPDWVFAPVWTSLYILMGISLYLVIRSGFSAPTVRQGIALFATQIIVNVLWSAMFFGLHSPLPALMVLVILIVLVVVTIVVFARISRPAAWLLIPYLGWCCFAALLNGLVVLVNAPGQS
jgi:tryptophan-rich sensory protein